MNNMMIFGDNMGAVDKMKDTDAGKLFKALLHHVNGEEPKDLSYAVQIVYDLLSGQVDRAKEIGEKRSESGKKAAAARWQKMPNDANAMRNDANACERMQSHTVAMRNDAYQSQSHNQSQINNNTHARVKKNSFFDFDQRTNVDLDEVVRREIQ